jgi:Tol biopolymer transport system component
MGGTRFWQFLIVAGAVASAVATTSAQQFTDWSPPVNLGLVVNSLYNDQHPAISPDGLSLYFVSDRPGGAGGLDLWVSQRDSLEDPWQTPLPLNVPINAAGTEFAPTFSPSGHLLFFSSDRPGGCGGQDLWVSFRQNKRDDFGWQPPTNLGCVVNSSGSDDGPSYVEEDDKHVTLYFTSLNRPGGLGDWDIWATAMNPDGTFDPPVNVIELNSPARDTRTAFRRGGREMLLTSGRPGGIGGLDLWVATRDDQSPVWSAPVDLGPVVNSTANDGAPALTRDGLSLFFYSNRAGGSGANDLYVSVRAKEKP